MDMQVEGPVLLWCHQGTALVTHSKFSVQLVVGDLYYSPETVIIHEDGLVVPLCFPEIRVTGSARRVHLSMEWADVIMHEFSRTLGYYSPAFSPMPGLTRIFDDPASPPPIATTPEAHAVSCIIADNPADQTSLDGFANRFGISSRTLQRQFLGSTGYTFSEWRTAYRVHAASELLALGFSVAVVANLVGFAATSSLTRAFRRHTGCAPSAYSLGMTGMGAVGEAPRIPGSAMTSGSNAADVTMWVYKGTATLTSDGFCRFLGTGDTATVLRDTDTRLEVAAQSIALPVAWSGEVPEKLDLHDVVSRAREHHKLVQKVEQAVH